MGTVRAPPPATTSPGHNTTGHTVAEEGKMVTGQGKRKILLVLHTCRKREAHPCCPTHRQGGEEGGGGEEAGSSAQPGQSSGAPVQEGGGGGGDEEQG